MKRANTDWLEQNGNDTLYGGSGIDMLIADVNPLYDLNASDSIDGHYRDSPDSVVADDNATDILLVLGTSSGDTIRIGQTAAGRSDGHQRGELHLDYNLDNNGRELFLPWRATVTEPTQLGTPLVEQIRVGGLDGNDRLEFLETADPGLQIEPLDIGDLSARQRRLHRGAGRRSGQRHSARRRRARPARWRQR